VKALRAVPAFASLDRRLLVSIAGASVNLFWKAGASVFEIGSPADGLYIVLSGAVRIIEPADGEEREIARLAPGEFFGEMALLGGREHARSARVLEDAELLIVPEESFRALLESHEVLATLFRREMI
jgi:CRP-like cAMP-binding protein